MACPDFTISKSGRTGVGVIQAHSGLDYPFFAPSEDIRYLVADFYLAYEDKTVGGQYQPPALPLRIKYLYNFGCVANTPPAGFPSPVGAIGIVVVDANDMVVFDSITQTLNYTTRDWGTDYTILEWYAATATCRMLVYKTWPETDDDKRNYNIYLAPQSAVLDSRTLYRIPKRVQSISVRNGASSTGQIRGDVIFRNSYNTEIAAGSTTTSAKFNVATPITFSAVAGSGLGKYPCDTNFDLTDLRVITQINGISGTAGDFTLSGKDCLWLRRPTTYVDDVVTPSATANLQLGADCKPCCACEDYASTALYMNSVRDRYKLIGTRAEAVRARHESNIARWNEHRICSVQSPLRVIFVPQRCPYMDIVMLLCNPCQSCLPTSTLTLTVSAEGDAVSGSAEAVTAEIACGYTAMYAAGINGLATSIEETSDLTYAVTFPQLQPGDSAYIKFRLKFSLKAPYLVRGVLTGALAVTGEPITIDCDGESTTPAQAETSQMLYCDAAGETEMPC
jgi:hypothetical protein